MTDWNNGYVTEIDYTYGYYPELNPMRCQLAFANQGIQTKKIETACELGFGQGLSANIHAASSSIEWWGTDFNPAQAGFAKELASISDSEARFFDQSFEEFCSREDIPNFDFIGLHGIWSWISDSNRKTIIDFVQRKLNVGGILYISYNTMPGWAGFVPMRHLLTQHADTMSMKGAGILAQIGNSIEFAQALLDTDPVYKKVNLQTEERIENLANQDKNYLAHEFFNADWNPMPFAEAKEWFNDAKLEFACSAYMLDHIDRVNLTPDQRTFLEKIPDSTLRHSTKDFMINQQFRRDYWVKGRRQLTKVDKIAVVEELNFLLVVSKTEVVLKIKGSQGEATMSADLYNPILDLMANHNVMSIAEIVSEASKSNSKLTLPTVLEAIVVLTGAGYVVPVTAINIAQRIQDQVSRLNNHLIERVRSGLEIKYLASPISGGGYELGRFRIIFLGAYLEGAISPDEIAQKSWKDLSRLGMSLQKEGKTLETHDEIMAELKDQAKTFIDTRLPILKALRII